MNEVKLVLCQSAMILKKYKEILVKEKWCYYIHTQYMVQNQIIQIDLEENILVIKGSVPGKPGNLLSIVPSE